MQKLLKSFGDWHAPIVAFIVLARCLRDIAKLVCCGYIVAVRHAAKYA
jgi:hypothetical protein